MAQQQDSSSKQNKEKPRVGEDRDRLRGGSNERPMDDPGRGHGDPYEELIPGTDADPKDTGR